MKTLPAGSRRTALWVVGLCLCLASCTVADNLNADDILVEIDGIVQFERGGAVGAVRYAEQAAVSDWYMRFVCFVPIRGVLGFLFGRRAETELESPPAHVRELLRELPDETAADPVLCTTAAVLFAQMAELDRSAETRLVAVDGLAAMMGQLAIPILQPPYDELGVPLAADAVERAAALLRTLAPASRGETLSGDAALATYVAALRELTSRPLGTAAARVGLVQQLLPLANDEPFVAVREVAQQALRRALAHLAEGVLLTTIADRTRDFAEVRLCAMEQVRRHGGPAAVPLLLAAMAASPAERAAGIPTFDPDRLIQLRLIHYCGQLRGDLATASVRLPGRADWEAQSAQDFLVTTILNERSYDSKLRGPALVALTWSLQRDRVDPDLRWVELWREQGRGQQP
jgi:hypothetical protein